MSEPKWLETIPLDGEFIPNDLDSEPVSELEIRAWKLVNSNDPIVYDADAALTDEAVALARKFLEIE